MQMTKKNRLGAGLILGRVAVVILYFLYKSGGCGDAIWFPESQDPAYRPLNEI